MSDAKSPILGECDNALPSSTHPPPESEDHDRFSSSSICHANFQSIALGHRATRLDASEFNLTS